MLITPLQTHQSHSQTPAALSLTASWQPVDKSIEHGIRTAWLL